MHFHVFSMHSCYAFYFYLRIVLRILLFAMQTKIRLGSRVMVLRESSEARRIGSRRNDAEQRRSCVALFASAFVRTGWSRHGAEVRGEMRRFGDTDRFLRTRTMLASMAQNHVSCGFYRTRGFPGPARYRCG